MLRAAVISNPTAGAGRAVGAAKAVADRLRAAGYEVTVMPTTCAGHATELARERQSPDRVVVVGGDGTLRETLVGLGAEPPPVAIVPMGNANVIARELGIPRTLDAAIDNAVHGLPRTVDVGVVNGRLFLAMVGVGYDGWATAGVGALRATRVGAFLYRNHASWLVYGLAGLPGFCRWLPNRVTVEIDGQPQPHRYVSAVVSNAETYALGWALTPGAGMDDGRFDLQGNRRCAPWFVAWTLLAAVARRRVPAFIADYAAGRTIRISSARPFRWQADGDPMGSTRELLIEVRPEAARLIAPEA